MSYNHIVYQNFLVHLPQTKHFGPAMLVPIFILFPTKIYSNVMNNNVGDMRWNLRKCNNVYVIIIPQINAMKVSLSTINVFFFARNKAT